MAAFCSQRTKGEVLTYTRVETKRIVPYPLVCLVILWRFVIEYGVMGLPFAKTRWLEPSVPGRP